MDEEDKFSPLTKPAFLDKERAESIGYVGAPDSIPEFDAELEPLPELEGEMPLIGKGPSRGYETRWREIARLHAMGHTNNQIGRHLGYSPTGISLALGKPFVQQEVAKWRESMFSQDTVNIIKDTARDGAIKLRQMLHDPRTKESVVVDISKFSIEKSTGKAKQEISVESGTLSSFYDLLKSMKDNGEPLDVTPIQTQVDVSPNESKDQDWDAWIDQNVK